MSKQGDLRIWWIPQIPGEPFYVNVKDLEQAELIYNTLVDYDIFQYANRIKPDYSNAGDLEVYEDGEWIDWYDEEMDDDFPTHMRIRNHHG